MQPDIKVKNNKIYVIGHYDNIIECAKLDFLCTLYGAKKSRGFAELEYNENFLRDFKLINKVADFACGTWCDMTCAPICDTECNRGCDSAACSHFCNTTCYANCQDDCAGSCKSGCGDECQRTCAWFCVTPSCQNDCNINCADTCRNICDRGNCRDGCEGDCEAKCADDCSDGCYTTCKNTCVSCVGNGGCSGGCDNGCSGNAMSEIASAVESRLTSLSTNPKILAKDLTDLETLIRNEMTRRSKTPASHSGETTGQLITAEAMNLVIEDLKSMSYSFSSESAGNLVYVEKLKAYMTSGLELYRQILNYGA